jgi:alpha-beta hydrolase superfamily lysophospholipase
MSAEDHYPDGTDTIVLIHGLWLTALSWEHWVKRYRARGYRVLAPDWPGMEPGTDELGGRPPEIARLGITEIVDHYDHLIRGLRQPPAIIGHSVGGLVAQMLLDRGLGAAGVAIDPAPTRATVRTTVSMLRAAFPALWNLVDARRTVPLTSRQFRRVLTNTLSRREAAAVRDRYYTPAPGRVIRGVSFPKPPDAATVVEFGNGQRAPLLLIAGGRDRIFPVTLTRTSFDAYTRSNAVTTYKEFPERSHYTIGEPGWEQVADYALRWAMENAGGRAIG